MVAVITRAVPNMGHYYSVIGAIIRLNMNGIQVSVVMQCCDHRQVTKFRRHLCHK